MQQSLIRKAVMGVAMSGLMMMSSTVHASAWTGISIVGNGHHSWNMVRLQMARVRSLVQSNVTHFTNVISVATNTGGNSMNGMTGGEGYIHTGDSTTYVHVSNMGGNNVAYIHDGCDECSSEPAWDDEHDHAWGDHDSSCGDDWSDDASDEEPADDVQDEEPADDTTDEEPADDATDEETPEEPVCEAEGVDVAYAADTLVSYDPGMTKDGSALATEKAVGEQALGWEDDLVASLGFGGNIVVMFDEPVAEIDGPDLYVKDMSEDDADPAETVLVEISEDGTTWYEVGTASSLDDASHSSSLDVFDTGLTSFSYVRLTDTSVADDFGDAHDGYDVDAVGAYGTVCLDEVASE